MIQGKFILGQEHMSELHKIWEEVFVKEAGLPKDQVCKEKYGKSIHAMVYVGSDLTCPVAAGSLAVNADFAELERIAVLRDYRGKQYGDFLVRMLLDKANSAGIQNIFVRVPDSEKEFFLKLGFIEQREELNSFGLPCISMKYSNNMIRKCCKEKSTN